jgi:hypothetical protein
MSSATVVRTTAIPSPAEIEARFLVLLPELRTRALEIAAASRTDPDEVLAEVMGFAWYDYRQSALKGRWLAAEQMAWYGRLRVREGHSLGSRRSKCDILSPSCQRKGRSKVVYLSNLIERRSDDPYRRQFDQIIGQGQRNPGDEAAVKIDWQTLRHRLPRRLRSVLDGIVTGRGTSEIARQLQVSPARVCQLKEQLAATVTGFFGGVLPDWTLTYS